jgi:hypothetical protein
MLALYSTAFAWAPHVEWKPNSFNPGNTRGYFIWHNQDGLHLFTTTKGERHHFSGIIRTDGVFVGVNGQRLESNDHFKVERNGHEIHFNFFTAGGEDGLHFKIFDGKRVNFNLFMDGRHINPREINVGQNNWHPGWSEFTLYQ